MAARKSGNCYLSTKDLIPNDPLSLILIQVALNLDMIGRPITLKLRYQKDRANIVRIQKTTMG